jgi:hypothetical protein
VANGLDILAALQGTSAGGVAGLDSLSYRPIETGYGIAAQGVASALPNLVNPYGSNFGNFASVLGGALVSGLLGYQARKATDERNLAQSRALTELLGANVTAERQQALLQESPRLAPVVSQLALQQKLQERSLAQEQAKSMRDAQMEVAKQRAIDMNIPLAEALRPATTTPATQATAAERPMFFGAKGEERLDKIRNTLQSNEMVKELEQVQTNIQSLTPAIFDETGISGVEFVFKAAKGLDPRSTVREGEFDTIAGSAGLAAQMNNYLSKAKGQGGLSLQQRSEIVDLVKREYNARVAQVQKRADAAVDRASRQLGIEKGDVERQDRLKQDLLGGLSLESADEIINKTATIPGVKLPGDFDISGRLTEIKDRTLNPEEFLANLRSQYGIEQQAQAAAAQQAQAAAAQQAPAEPKPLSDIAAKVEATRNDPSKAFLVDFQQKRISELLAKDRANLTAEERAEWLGILKFFGVR